MNNQRKLLDLLWAGGICLLGLALLDGAIEGLERVSEINLWKTCGVIGGVLVGAYIVLGIFDRESYLRQGVRLGWDRLRARWPKRTEAKDAAAAEAEAVADAKTDEPDDWVPPAVEDALEDATEDEHPTDRFPLPVEAASSHSESNGSAVETEEGEPEEEEAATSSGTVSRLPK